MGGTGAPKAIPGGQSLRDRRSTGKPWRRSGFPWVGELSREGNEDPLEGGGNSGQRWRRIGDALRAGMGIPRSLGREEAAGPAQPSSAGPWEHGAGRRERGRGKCRGDPPQPPRWAPAGPRVDPWASVTSRTAGAVWGSLATRARVCS